MDNYLGMMTNLSNAAEEYHCADHFIANLAKYIQVYDDVMLMGFDLEVELVCRLIAIARGDAQSVCNAVLMGVV